MLRLKTFGGISLEGAARIASGFELVSGTGRDLPARHQTIREAVTWSVALLTPSERSTFGRMAIFAGGCTIDAAEWAECDADVALLAAPA